MTPVAWNGAQVIGVNPMKIRLVYRGVPYYTTR
jgi:hypothetical protein